MYEIAGTRRALAQPVSGPLDIVLRPESVVVEPAGAHTQRSPSAVPAVVQSITYLGAAWRVAVELADGQTLLATMDRQGAAERLRPGEPVLLHWAPDAVTHPEALMKNALPSCSSSKKTVRVRAGF